MKRLAVTAALLCLFSVACASSGSIQKQPLDLGTARHYDADLQRAVSATRDAMVGASLGMESVNQVAKDTWMLVGKKGVSGFSWGELVRAVVQADQANGGVTVRIVTQRRVATNVTARGDWSQQILSQLDLSLGGGRSSQAPATKG